MKRLILVFIITVFVSAQSDFENGVKKFLFYDNDYSISLRLFEKSCSEEKVAMACYMAAIILNRSGDQKSADELYKRACDMGSMQACSVVGDMYNEGFGGFDVNYAKARELYLKACDAKVASACMRVAAHYNAGIGGVQEDFKRAVELYEKACKYGDLQGCITIALVYKNGSAEVKRDIKKAAEFYGMACDRGFDEGCMEFRRLNKQ
ncbi:tetratricopeptide repeat protein [Campylobacter sp.]|uniref:tetratricopeptide repeat protein n=1 Tax=Campylobacter sp. TaxID=205 RepID=UPI00270C50E5|nr:tetratricopeptide repeat protein [Campylobacter sp.]